MIDFLKANPCFTKEDYLWSLTIPQIAIMASDSTHIEDLEEGDGNSSNKENSIFNNIPVI